MAELNEGDNLHAAGVSLCVAAEDVFEDDGTPGTALLLAPGASQARNFSGPGDQDWVRLGVQPGRFYVLNTSSLSPGVDTRLRLTGPGGQPVLAFNDDAHAATLASELWWSPPVPGAYYALVDAWNPATGGCSASYTLNLVDAGPGYVAFFPFLKR